MRIKSVTALNFGSYKNLSFSFENQGLTLIQGATGSGKSTLCDLIPWALFGKTAKGGAVSEVLTWPGDQVTEVTLAVEINNQIHHIFRKRGPNSKDNDLYWMSDCAWDIPMNRGKDIPDTQRLINQLVGMDYDLYLASAYYHEFSQTAQFFTTTAKNRRIICEQLVDLTLAKTLQLKASEDLKALTKQQDNLEHSINATGGKLSLLARLQVSENVKAETWDKTHIANKQAAIRQCESFEINRKKIVSKKCNSCGTVLQHPREVIDTSENPYISRLAELDAEVNPYTGNVKDYSTEIEAQIEERDQLTEQSMQLSNDILDLEILSQVIGAFRATAIQNTINDIETKTNAFLSKHFNAELRVEFDVTDTDKLEITIYKDGNTATFTQLSKGQRCLLKLTFGTAVMEAVANHHSITPTMLWFDESLDGLDSDMKEKAFHMLETISISKESVFVVEHSENLKALFTNSYSVGLTSEGSVIAKTK